MVGEELRRGHDQRDREPLAWPEVALPPDRLGPGLRDQQRSPGLRRPGGIDLSPRHHRGLLGVGDGEDVFRVGLPERLRQVVAGGNVLGVALLWRRKAFALQVFQRV